MTDTKEGSTAENSEFFNKAMVHVEPILKHLNTGDTIVDKEKISELFVKLWEYEGGEKLDSETQRLTARKAETEAAPVFGAVRRVTLSCKCNLIIIY